MERVSLRNNPLLAALLGTVVTGLGHLYLRRWLRALGWLAATIGASALFVPASTMAAIGSGTLTDPLSILPVVLISAASAFDAYLIAKVRNRPDDGSTADAVGPPEADDPPACPACGKPVDPEIGFCHWCTTEFEAVDVTEPERTDENHSTR